MLLSEYPVPAFLDALGPFVQSLIEFPDKQNLSRPLVGCHLDNLIIVTAVVVVLQSKKAGGGGWGGFLHDKLLQKGFRLSVSGGSFPHAHLLGSKCPPPEERCLSKPETGEKERNCLFKSYTNLE